MSHRLSTVEYADRIVAMDKGQVVASGCHKELLERNEVDVVLCDDGLQHDALAGDLEIARTCTAP